MLKLFTELTFTLIHDAIFVIDENVSFTSVDVPDYCASNPSAVVADEDDCAQFFNCSDPNSRNGTAMECKYPDLFSRLTMHCEVFTNISCDSRIEPQAPCELLSLRLLRFVVIRLYCFNYLNEERNLLKLY